MNHLEPNIAALSWFASPWTDAVAFAWPPVPLLLAVASPTLRFALPKTSAPAPEKLPRIAMPIDSTKPAMPARVRVTGISRKMA